MEIAFHNVVKITIQERLFPHGTMGGFSTTRIIATDDKGEEVDINFFHPTVVPTPITTIEKEQA